MLRFIVLRHKADHNEGTECKEFITLDKDIPELEAMLIRGGRGEMGFELWTLLGVEIIIGESRATTEE